MNTGYAHGFLLILVKSQQWLFLKSVFSVSSVSKKIGAVLNFPLSASLHFRFLYYSVSTS